MLYSLLGIIHTTKVTRIILGFINEFTFTRVVLLTKQCIISKNTLKPFCYHYFNGNFFNGF